MQSRKAALPTWAPVAIIGLILAAVIGGLAFSYLYDLRQERALAAELTIEDQDLSSIHNGVYYGSQKLGRTLYGVQVTIKDYVITDIKVVSNRKNNYAKRAEGVIQNVLARGNVNADIVTGATTSSKALLKAIEQAIACNL